METSITLNNISKSFLNKEIFTDLSYKFYKRNYHLIGKNGAGKSTLLRLLVGLENLDSGTILLNENFEINISSTQNTKKIFYVPDDLAIYHFLTGLEFLSWISKVRTSNNEEINDVIDKLELRKSQNSYIGDMSLGTKKKFLLATALIGNPDFIILDEPLNGLDKNSQYFLLTLLREKSLNSGIILTSHHEANIELLSPLKVEIINGKLVETEPSVSEII